jgi:hypothetical protein
MEKHLNLNDYLRELWQAFEKTGSIGAYLLYNDLREKSEKQGRVREKGLMSKDNA